jgi:hypothetical protein
MMTVPDQPASHRGGLGRLVALRHGDRGLIAAFITYAGVLPSRCASWPDLYNTIQSPWPAPNGSFSLGRKAPRFQEAPDAIPLD